MAFQCASVKDGLAGTPADVAALCKTAAGLAALIGKLQNAMEEISIGELDDEVSR